MATVTLADYTGDVSGTNWTPALIAALDDIKAKGGIIDIHDDIELNTQFRTADVASIPTYTPLTLRGDGSPIVTLDGIAGNAIVTNSSYQKFVMEGFAIIGDADGSHTSTSAIVGAAEQWIVNRMVFARIHAGGSVLHGVNNNIMTIRDSRLGSCRAGAGGATVFANNTNSLIMENVSMFDYQNFRGVAYENPGGYSPHHIRAVYTGGSETVDLGYVHLKNVRGDEGTLFCYIEGYPRVKMEGCGANVNSGGPSVHLKSVASARIENHWAGYTAGDAPAIKLEECGYVEVEGLQIHNGIYRIELDAATEFLKVTNSPGVVVDAEAGARYEINGVKYRGSVVQVG